MEKAAWVLVRLGRGFHNLVHWNQLRRSIFGVSISQFSHISLFPHTIFFYSLKNSFSIHHGLLRQLPARSPSCAAPQEPEPLRQTRGSQPPLRGSQPPLRRSQPPPGGSQPPLRGSQLPLRGSQPCWAFGCADCGLCRWSARCSGSMNKTVQHRWAITDEGIGIVFFPISGSLCNINNLCSFVLYLLYVALVID